MARKGFTDSMTLGEARDELRPLVMGPGAVCPCCKRFAKRYKRSINASMARGLIKLYRAGAADDYVHVPEVLPTLWGGDAAKLRYWGLITEHPTRRDDGGRAGYWRITPLGVDYLHGTASVPKYVWVYGRRCLGIAPGPRAYIADALGEPFNLAELMAA
jgi:hypothetical protein